MATAVGGPPAQGGSWVNGCRLGAPSGPGAPGVSSTQPPQGACGLPPTGVPHYAGMRGPLPAATAAPMFQSQGPINVASPSPKGLDSSRMAAGAPLGEPVMQADAQEAPPPLDPWMGIPQRPVPQQYYYEGPQGVLQQEHLHQQQQQQPGLPGGPQGMEPPAAPMGMTDGSRWVSQMEFATEGPRGPFGFGVPCVLPAASPSPPLGSCVVTTMPAGPPFVGAGGALPPQASLTTWPATDRAQHEHLKGPTAPPPLGVCINAAPGQQGGELTGAPAEGSGAPGGPWYPLQQQPLPATAAGNYCSLPNAAPAKTEGKNARQSRAGSGRKRGDQGGEGECGGGGAPATGAPSSVTRLAKFFKQHSPAKAPPKAKPKSVPLQSGGFTVGEVELPKPAAAVDVRAAAPKAGGGVGGHNQELGGPSLDSGKGPLEGSEQQLPALPKAAPRPKGVRPSEVMAKMYFHRKKEAWRAELLIEGTKKQKSFSCRLYGYERARLMCEWARKFVLRTSRLPTDEETCNSLASLMKDPLPPHVPPPLPPVPDDCTPTRGSPNSTEPPFAAAPPRDASAAPPAIQVLKHMLLSHGQQPSTAAAAAAAPSADSLPLSVGDLSAGLAGSPLGPGSRKPLEAMPAGAPALCKKRKESTKPGDSSTKMRKGGNSVSCAAVKKSPGPPRAPEGPSTDSEILGGPLAAEREPKLLPAGATNGAPSGPGDSREAASSQDHLLSPYVLLSDTPEPPRPFAQNTMPALGVPAELPELSLACEAPLMQVDGFGGAPLPPREVMGEPRMGCFEPARMQGAGNTWFEELEQLKKISRPKGGRAKRFNVGKKPFSGVRGIYFQQGLWKVKYRGEQEEAMKLFPYSPGDEKQMKCQFELARSFLRQVIDKGRHLHDSDGEGLSEEEPAWVVRGGSSGKWGYRKEAQQLNAPRQEQPIRSKSPSAAAQRRRSQPLGKGSPSPPGGSCEALGGAGVGGPCGAGDWPEPSNEGMSFDPGHPSLPLSSVLLPRGLPFCAGDGLGASPPAVPFSEQQGMFGEEGPSEQRGECGFCQQMIKVESISHRSPWDPPPDPNEGEGEEERGAPHHHRRAGLRLPPLTPCGGIFTAADSPLSQRVSPNEKGGFQQESSTGFFSDVTTTTDEVPPGSVGVSSNISAAASEGSNELKAIGARFAHAVSKSNAAPACAFLGGEAAAPLCQPLQQGGPSDTNPSPSSGDRSQQLQHACMPPSPAADTCASACAPLFQQVGVGGPKETDDGPLQFRPLTDHTTKYLEVSLGEELLSVASHPCSFGAPDCCNPTVPQHAASGFASLHAGEEFSVEGGPSKGPLDQQTSSTSRWTIESIALSFSRPKDEAAAAACKREGLDNEERGGAGLGARNSRSVAPLPWVVVRPREEEEKALTPLAGKAAGCFFHVSPAGHRCTTQQSR
ncbi:hypothetical protein Esti_003248 [Eimeria stiedai]